MTTMAIRGLLRNRTNRMDGWKGDERKEGWIDG
jgi:hypothetical protein